MTGTPENKTCALCRFSTGEWPVMCRMHTDTHSGRPRLAVPLRASTGPCGPEGAFFEPINGPKATATILKFPSPHRVSA